MTDASGSLAAANAGVRFLLEVAALVVLGYWGYRTGDGQAVKVGLGVGIPLVVAAVWATLGAPAAPYRLGQPWRLGLELVILGAATIALLVLDRPLFAVAYGAVAAINTALLYVLGQA